MSNELPRLQKGEKPPPGFVGLDDEGHFVHYCPVCGKFGPYGFGHFPREGKMGTWYCREHKPT
jgi:hypothetical protein